MVRYNKIIYGKMLLEGKTFTVVSFTEMGPVRLETKPNRTGRNRSGSKFKKNRLARFVPKE